MEQKKQMHATAIEQMDTEIARTSVAVVEAQAALRSLEEKQTELQQKRLNDEKALVIIYIYISCLLSLVLLVMERC